MVGRIKEILKPLRISFQGNGDAYKFCFGRDLFKLQNNRIVNFGVQLWRHPVLQVRFVQYFPVRKFIMVPGFMEFTQFIGKASLGIPAENPCKVACNFLTCRIAKLLALVVFPEGQVRIGRVHYWLGRFEHPYRYGTEVDYRGMPLRCFHKICKRRIGKLKIPEGFCSSRGLKFCYCRLWVRKPGYITHIIGSHVF
ncbi:hypothetical protein D3C87_1389110 [compost metagenome]